ncbi:hypothetical protein LTR78_003621 [Recurvomyces mirabilis]|uniref:Cercosporin MFS transporter CTB4 n=1 Tax=Recurvomyces mirabilis TaxID=574656 RepID=A0AAE1C348_9PEZI|nr:hypothetical protein LTR78_003621 [Recurvomyces mirabilis]KAK5154735.1 hypothetical protein LTS14_006314 [Recurvomyces mirabilis]
MTDLIRDAPMGQLIRYITRNKVLLYPEERPDFEAPSSYTNPDHLTQTKGEPLSTIPSSLAAGDDEKKHLEPTEPASPQSPSTSLDRRTLERIETSRTEVDLEKALTNQRTNTLSLVPTRTALSHAHTQAELAAVITASAHLAKEPSQPIVPQRTADGTILVDWYTTDDAANPQNWSSGKKVVASLQIYLYTLAVYMGSSIYTPSAEGIMNEFHVGVEAASLGLALYVLAYGTGPLIWSPLSEIPSIGRNPPYMITMGIFVILIVPTALVQNFTGLLVLRFLLGFFGSPALATGGASLQDMYSLIKLPYVLCLWALAATGGPALGPVISGFSVTAENWRWSMWEMLWLSGPVFLAMLLFLPETSSANILLRRAQRLRKLTGDMRLKAQSEIDQKNMRPKDVAFEALVRPLQLIFMDPAIGFTAGYVALCYGIYYSFFEAFPLVYIDKYHFSVGEMGLAFLSILIGALLGIAGYYTYLYYVVEPDMIKNGLGKPERRLIPALVASFLLPIGLFMFAWTGDANVHVHWIASIIGCTIFVIGVFILMQCIFVYLPFVYPQYAASLFAGNDFARSVVAFAAVLFSRPMYVGLGIGPGTSLLAALTTACVGGIFVLFFYGEKLRARSRFSAK